MTLARDRVDLDKFSCDGLIPRRDITGALLLKVPGLDGENTAKKIKKKLQNTLSELKGVRISKSVRTVELRIKDLTECTSQKNIFCELAATGGFTTEEIKVGKARWTNNGFGTIWAKCPAHAAEVILRNGIIILG